MTFTANDVDNVRGTKYIGVRDLASLGLVFLGALESMSSSRLRRKAGVTPD